jgi:hypothetical protein
MPRSARSGSQPRHGAGIDLDPLDVRDDEDLRWLNAFIRPEQAHRHDRQHAAAQIARADPPHLIRGDLITDLPALAAERALHRVAAHSRARRP